MFGQIGAIDAVGKIDDNKNSAFARASSILAVSNKDIVLSKSSCIIIRLKDFLIFLLFFFDAKVPKYFQYYLP